MKKCKWGIKIVGCQFRNGVGMCVDLYDCPHACKEGGNRGEGGVPK